METKKISIVAHGGAGSENEHSDGTEKAINTCYKAFQENTSLIHAVSLAVNVLEDDGRYNAGSGSHARENGKVEHDAAIMDSEGCFGAVAAMKGFKNPIQAAKAVSNTKYQILAGEGATKFAENLNLEPAQLHNIPGGGKDFSTPPTTDTVGCVAFDGTSFVAALSTGGMAGAHYGRVGDVPIIGSGLYAGPDGAVAATGDGEAIMMKITAYRTYELIRKGASPEVIVDEVINWFPPTDAFGLILVTRTGSAGGSNRSMAWSSREFD
jgi:L-asparaginase / beta-aspartyl-peptidase